MSNPRAKRCVGCGLWLNIRTQVCYICGADQTAPHQAKVPVSGTMDPAKETARRLLVTDVDPGLTTEKESL